LTDVPAPTFTLPDDTAAVIDEEIARLPEKLRTAFVLCELDGRPDAEAAAALGCPLGTVLSRLSRARARLRSRLTRRGLAPLAAGVLATASGGVSAAVVGDTVAVGAGRLTASARVMTLAGEVARNQLGWNVAAAVIAVSVVSVVCGVVVASPGPPAQQIKAPVPAAPAPREYQVATADEGQEHIDRVEFSPDGKWVLTRGSKTVVKWTDHTVVVWDAKSGKKAHAFTKGLEVGYSSTFSPDGQRLAVTSGGSDPARVYDTATWKATAEFAHLFAGDARFTSDRTRLLTRSWGTFQPKMSGLVLWDFATGKPAWKHDPVGNEQFASAELSPDGKSVVLGTSVGTSRLIDATTGKVRAELKVREEAENQAAFSPDGKRVLTWTTGFEVVPGKASGKVRLWDAATGELERTFEGHDSPVITAGFTPDGKHVVAASTSGGLMVVWDAATGKQASSFPLSDAPFAQTARMSISPDGKRVAVGGWEGKAGREKVLTAVFALPGGKEFARLPGVREAVFNHDGSAAALVSGGWAISDPPNVVTVCPVAALPKR
jgi:WD40 repeat protein